MDEIETQPSNLLNEVGTGFSTPSSSSLDTCDSGFTEMYPSNLSLINSTAVDDKLPITILSDAMVSPSLTQIQPTLGVDSNGKTDIQIDTNVLTTDETSSGFIARLAQTSFHHSQNGIDHSVDYKMTGKNEITCNMNSNDVDEDETDNFDDVDSISSDMSELSDAFKINSEITPEMQRSINWVHSQIASGINPRDCLSRIFINSSKSAIPENISDNDLWRIIAAILSDPPRRQRLQHIQTIEDVCQTIAKSNNIIVLTGAGVSVSCGIPDFRSRDGIYERLRVEYPDMRDPQSMFDIAYFAQDPRPFYQFAREIYPGLFEPSLSHRFIKLLEMKGKLLRNYTQNIDTLERVAGIENVIECHGSFATASCTRCKIQVDAVAIREDIIQQRIPMCTICNSSDNEHPGLTHRMERPLNYSHLVTAGIMKPDIVFFGESLPDKFHSTIELDKAKCDLLIVIGSSLKVRPVALIPNSIAPLVPQILINREQLNHFSFDVKLLGDSDVIINQLCHILGTDWTKICATPSLTLTTDLDLDRAKEIMSNKVLTEYKSITEVSDTFEYPDNKLSKVEEETVSEESKSETTDESSKHKNSEPSTNDPSISQSSTTLLSMSPKSEGVDNTAIIKPSPPVASTSSEVPICDNDVIDSAQKNTTVKQQRNIEFQKQEETITKNLRDFLPDHCYFYDAKNCYIFPGAESWWNLNESDDEDNSDSMSSLDSDDNDDFETYADTDATQENCSNQAPDMFNTEAQFNRDAESMKSHNINFNHSEVNNCLFSQISNNQNDSSHAQFTSGELDFNKLSNVKQYTNVSQLESNYTTITTVPPEMRVNSQNSELVFDELDKLITEAGIIESTGELQKDLIAPCVKKDLKAFKLNDEHSRDSYEIAQKRRKYSM